MSDIERERFEKWARIANYRGTECKFVSGPLAGEYIDSLTQHVWHAWQASAAAPQCEDDTVRVPLAKYKPFDQIGADRMAAIVDLMVRNRQLDPRSPLADARLDYGQPFTDEEARKKCEDDRREGPHDCAWVYDARKLRNALRELIRLKDIKEKLEKIEPPRTDPQRNYYAEELREEYERGKDAAWQAARAAMESGE